MSLNSQFLTELQWRGLIHDSTDLQALDEHLSSGKRSFYMGFDPSSESLTIGNLLAMVLVIRGARAGLNAVVLLGGGTGLIGDPSGKSEERTLLPIEEAERNAANQKELMMSIFKRALKEDQLPRFANNIDWLGKLNAIEFLRDVGKHFSVTEMMRRDSVKRRVSGETGEGLSYTEFSYSLLQSYDYMQLCRDFDVTLQMGASDQWGNIVAGIDYVRRILGKTVYALTCPLLLRADGTKFGKTEKGAIWISAARTSPYQFYQFIINIADEEAEKFALNFSLESREFLENLFAAHKAAPHERKLQRHMARELTTLVHGEEACKGAEAATQALFSGDVKSLELKQIEEIFADAPSVNCGRDQLEAGALNLVTVLAESGLVPSKGQAKKDLPNGAISVNGEQVKADITLTRENLLHNSVLLLRRGKKDWRIVRFTS
jgi:tyrosyl-tRNA synthetase